MPRKRKEMLNNVCSSNKKKYKKETICAVTGAQPVVFRSKEVMLIW